MHHKKPPPSGAFFIPVGEYTAPTLVAGAQTHILRPMRILLISVLLLAASLAQAGVYTWVDKNGKTHYGDHPPPDGSATELPPIKPNVVQTQKAPKIEGESDKAKANKDANAQVIQYRALTITEPAAGATLRDNGGNINVKVSTEPALSTSNGDTIWIYLDGTVVSKGNASPVLANVDRGAHRLRATIVNKQGETLIKSAVVTVYLHRTSVHRPAP